MHIYRDRCHTICISTHGKTFLGSYHNQKQQYYSDIAFQYGKLIKLILDVDPIEDETLAAYIPGVSEERGLKFVQWAKDAIDSFFEPLIHQHKDKVMKAPRKTLKAIKSTYDQSVRIANGGSVHKRLGN